MDSVVAHYQSTREQDRLRHGVAELELVRTQEVLRRHLPPPPARVVDVGGATGAHAEWLLAAGYRVHLVDITPRHVDTARRELGPSGLTAEIGDARQLALADASADAVLLLGPLYHLLERPQRIAALREVARVVRPGGVVAAAAISRFASLFDGLARGHLFEPEFRRIVDGDLGDGRHFNPDNRPHWFTDAYFHHPDELTGEIGAAGLEVVELVGVEGLAGWLSHLDERWSDPVARDVIVDSARRVEHEPTLLGLSAHLLAVARAPG